MSSSINLVRTRLSFLVILFLVLASVTGCARAQTVSGPIDAPRGFLTTIAINKPIPKYPAGSLERGAGGIVDIDVIVDKHGRVRVARVISTPDSEIGEAARIAARQWTFQTGTVRDQPVEAQGILSFHFDSKTSRVDVNLAEKSDSLVSAAEVRNFPRLTEADLTSASATKGDFLLDFRNRQAYRTSHRPGAFNIPLDELPRRSRELANHKRVLIDCTSTVFEECVDAATHAAASGVNNIAYLIAGGQSSTDPVTEIVELLKLAVALLESGKDVEFLKRSVSPASLRIMTRSMSIEQYAASRRKEWRL